MGIVEKDDLDEFVGQPENDGMLRPHPLLHEDWISSISTCDEVLLALNGVVEVTSEVGQKSYFLLKLLGVLLSSKCLNLFLSVRCFSIKVMENLFGRLVQNLC